MSDDLTTIDLFRIHDDRQTLDTLHALQLDRLDEKTITGGDRPGGMRLSTADPIRRVKSAFDPFWQIPFDDGVGARGHLLEDYLEVALFGDDMLDGRYYGCKYETQRVIQWHEHGRSAFDWVVHVGVDRPVSCKSSIKGGKPSSANADQERRMMAADGYPAGSEFEIWMVNVSTLRATGPHVYTLDQEHIDAWRDELAGVSKAYQFWAHELTTDPTGHDGWNDPEAWSGMFGLESTSGAFRYDTLDASGAIEARNRTYLRARAAAAEAKRAEEDAKALIRTHVEEQIAAAIAAGEQVKSVAAFSGDEIATYTIDKRGAMRVTTRPFNDAQSAA